MYQASQSRVFSSNAMQIISTKPQVFQQPEATPSPGVQRSRRVHSMDQIIVQDYYKFTSPTPTQKDEVITRQNPSQLYKDPFEELLRDSRQALPKPKPETRETLAELLKPPAHGKSRFRTLKVQAPRGILKPRSLVRHLAQSQISPLVKFRETTSVLLVNGEVQKNKILDNYRVKKKLLPPIKASYDMNDAWKFD